MTHTSARVWQWVGIILILCILGGAYWYFEVRAGYKTNVSPTGSLTSGLVGYWTFDGADVSGTTATDRSGNSNTGTLTGGPAVTPGKVGQALQSNAYTKYVTAGSPASLDDINQKTIIFWVKPITISGLDSYPLTKGAWSVKLTPTNNVTYNQSFSTQLGQWASPTNSIQLNEWNFIAVTYDRSSTVNDPIIYINGAVVSVAESLTPVGTVSSDSSQSLSICSAQAFSFNNVICDEVRVYNRALTTSEIQSLYKAGQSDEVNSGASQAQGGSRLDSGLAGYWKLDDGSGTSATDSSTNANTGTLTNGPTWTTGQIGSAVDFDGTDDYISIPDAANNRGSRPMTAVAWVKRDAVGEGDAIFMKRGGTNDGWGLIIGSDNKLAMSFYGIADRYSVSTITDTAWHHIVATVDGSGNLMFYIDGSSAGSTGNFSSSPTTTTQPLRLGVSTTSDGTINGYQDFSLDEARIYNRALSADEVAELYRLNTPSGTDTGFDGYWSFNGKDVSGTTAYDRSGSGNNGTLTNGPTVTPGKLGQALNFDGTNDSVVLNTSTVLKPALFTVSTWAYADTGSINYRGIYLPSYADGYNSGFLLYINNDGHAAVRYGNGSAPVGNITSGESVLGGWHYLVTTFDGTTLTLFVDGVEKASTTASTLAYAGGSTTAQIGAGNGTDAFDGKLDEFRLYGRAFSEAEIVAQYTAGRSDEVNSGASQAQGGSRLDSGLAGYWKLDDGSGTSATDSSTNSNTGTLTNGPTWTTGQIGGAVNFDGTDDYIDLGTTKTYIDDGKPFTAAIWLNADVFSGVSRPAYTFKTNGLKGWVSFLDSGASYEDFSFGRDTSSSKRISFPGGFTTGVWRHVVIVYNGNGFNTTSNYTAYVDGASVVVNSSSTLVSIENENYIGSYRSGGSRGYWDGKLDDLRFYNRQLSADEVSQLYRLSAPTGTDTSLKGYWSFNGKDVSGTTAYDRSGSGNNGTITNGPTVTPGKVGQALRFDGTDDYVTVADVVSLEPTSAITVSAWIKRGMTLGTIQVIAAKGRFASASNAQYMIHFNASNFIEFSLGDGVNPSSKVTSTSTLTSTSQWYFIVGTYDGTTQRLYIDGVEAATPVSWSQSITTTADAFVIGNRPNFFSWPFSGSIDEVRVYNRALSATEIASLYNASR